MDGYILVGVDSKSTVVYVYMCICVSVYLCICVSVYLCICVSVYLCICVSVYMCICVPQRLFLLANARNKRGQVVMYHLLWILINLYYNTVFQLKRAAVIMSERTSFTLQCMPNNSLRYH